MQKNKKNEILTADYFWDNFSLYSTRPKIKVISREFDNTKCKKASCSLENAVKFLYTDSSGNYKSNFIPQAKNVKNVNLGLNKIGKKSYLTDNGETFSQLSQTGMKKNEFVKLLKGIDTDYDLSVMNDELCSEISDPSLLADCYRNLVNVIIKVRFLSKCT